MISHCHFRDDIQSIREQSAWRSDVGEEMQTDTERRTKRTLEDSQMPSPADDLSIAEDPERSAMCSFALPGT
eukprot:2897445-Pyramimonas_sp.AAC.1